MSEQIKFKIKGCSILRHCILVDAETDGDKLSLQMPIEIAEQIVRACNAHEDLMVACRWVKKQINLEGSVSATDDALCKQLEAAIAKGAR